jgi:hypothetical protein
VVEACNPSTQESEAGLQIQGQPELHRETFSQKGKKRRKEKGRKEEKRKTL